MKFIRESVSKATKQKLYKYTYDAVYNALVDLEDGALNVNSLERNVPGYDSSYFLDGFDPEFDDERNQAIEFLTDMYVRESLAEVE